MIKVVNPSVEVWKQDGYTLDAIFKHIAKCTLNYNIGQIEVGYMLTDECPLCVVNNVETHLNL